MDLNEYELNDEALENATGGADALAHDLPNGTYVEWYTNYRFQGKIVGRSVSGGFCMYDVLPLYNGFCLDVTGPNYIMQLNATTGGGRVISPAELINPDIY